MSTAPQRKPATPLMAFHSTGKYANKSLKNYQNIRRYPAQPGVSATKTERNKKEGEEINVKPSVHDRFNSKFYVPNKYLNPYGSAQSVFPIRTSTEPVKLQKNDIIVNDTKKATIADYLKTRIQQDPDSNGFSKSFTISKTNQIPMQTKNESNSQSQVIIRPPSNRILRNKKAMMKTERINTTQLEEPLQNGQMVFSRNKFEQEKSEKISNILQDRYSTHKPFQRSQTIVNNQGLLKPKRENSMGSSFCEKPGQQFLMKGDWEPGINQKAYVTTEDPRARYNKLFNSKQEHNNSVLDLHKAQGFGTGFSFEHNKQSSQTSRRNKTCDNTLTTIDSSQIIQKGKTINKEIIEQNTRITYTENDIQNNYKAYANLMNSKRYDNYKSIPISRKIDQSLNYKYQSSIPDYLRIDPEQLNLSQNNHPERIYILSKQENDGWLTVDSTNMNRKQAYEKQTKKLVNRETSPLSPSWMQNINNLKTEDITLSSLQKMNVKYGQARSGNLKTQEDNRVILYDTYQPLSNGQYHLQSTNSVFHQNPIQVAKKDFQAINKEQTQRLNDFSIIYTEPKKRFSVQQEYYQKLNMAHRQKLATHAQNMSKKQEIQKPMEKRTNSLINLQKVQNPVTPIQNKTTKDIYANKPFTPQSQRSVRSSFRSLVGSNAQIKSRR